MIGNCFICMKEIDLGHVYHEIYHPEGSMRKCHEGCYTHQGAGPKPKNRIRTVYGQRHYDDAAGSLRNGHSADVRDEVGKQFIQALNAVGKAIYLNAVEKGFWEEDYGDHTDATKIMLSVTELSECVEVLREDRSKPSEKIPGFTQYEEEQADAIIRELDLAFGRDLRVGEAIIAKIAYNRRRAAKHGKGF